MDEKVVEQSMEIITYSGNGRAQVINALRQLFKDGDIAKAREEIAAGGKEIGEAHQMQTDLISAECDGQEVEKSVLLIHAQDHFMTALAVRDIANLMVDMYESLTKNNKMRLSDRGKNYAVQISRKFLVGSSYFRPPV